MVSTNNSTHNNHNKESRKVHFNTYFSSNSAYAFAYFQRKDAGGPRPTSKLRSYAAT